MDTRPHIIIGGFCYDEDDNDDNDESCNVFSVKGILIQAILDERCVCAVADKEGGFKRPRGICSTSDGVRVNDVRYLNDGTLVLIVALVLFDTVEVSKSFPCPCLAVVSAVESDGAFLVPHRSIMHLATERNAKVSKHLLDFSPLVSISNEKREELILRCAPLLTSSVKKTKKNCFKTDKFNDSGSANWCPNVLLRSPLSMKSKPGKKSSAHLSNKSRSNKKAKTSESCSRESPKNIESLAVSSSISTSTIHPSSAKRSLSAGQDVQFIVETFRVAGLSMSIEKKRIEQYLINNPPNTHITQQPVPLQEIPSHFLHVLIGFLLVLKCLCSIC
jgi:hypothetical protein